MSTSTKNISILVFFLAINESYSLGFDDYISKLYDNNKNEISKILLLSIDRIYPKNNELENDLKNDLCELLFLHLLFTTTDAVDCTKGGILKIPYFWHWTIPNPRHYITYKSTTKRLNEVQPPSGYKKYKSYADIDRTPFIYLDNLFEKKPLFYHKDCGYFYTFGWCSEREMAFNCILDILGYKSKIKQEGIHVWTEVLLSGTHIITIDNTFNGFQIDKLKTSINNWIIDFGNGAQVGWYNRKAHSIGEIGKIKNIDISDETQKRIQEHIRNWYVKIAPKE